LYVLLSLKRYFVCLDHPDDCTRIRVLKVYDGCNQGTAIRFMDDVRRRLPFRIHVVHLFIVPEGK
jgi:hypothetical protein